MLVDSHCHLDCLDLSHYDGDLDAAMAAAHERDVQHMLCVCIDLDNFPKVLAIAERYPRVMASVGLHPTHEPGAAVDVKTLTDLAQHPKIVAIGETGLDYYRIEGDRTWQQQRFRTHIQAAKECDKPLIIHTRQAREDTIQIMREEKAEQVGGVMHCFSEDLTMAQQAMELNFYISFSGIVTFKNAKELQALATQVPLDRLLIETDAPYLAPVPFRGKSNEPAYVYYVAEKIAELRGESLETIAQVTTENYFKCFKHDAIN